MYFGLPFCRPQENKGRLEGIGESILGYELRRAPLSISFGVPTRSGELCKKTLSFQDANIFAYAVKQEFWFQMFLDDLPVWGIVGEEIENEGGQKALYIFTHLHFDISRNNNQVIEANLTSENPVLIQEGAELSFTYSVSWSQTNIKFSDRFDRYLDRNFFEHQVHWFSLFNSSMLLVFLVGLVGIIFLRTTQKDFVLGEDDPDEDAGEELSWKLVQRDVFRPPQRLVFLSALVGCGYQILSSMTIVLGLGVIGAHYHESRGSILSAFIMWYTLSSFVAGYFSGSIYAKNKGLQWIKTAFITSFILPFFAVFLVGTVNLMAFYNQVMSYIPLGALFLLAVIWAVLCVPVSLVGTFFGRHLGKSALQNQQMPVNQVPRMIPTLPWYQQTWAVILWSGILPFSTLFVELFFIYSSVFHYKFYYIYGFAALVLLLFVLVSMTVSVVTTFFFLNSEYYKWHWTSFKMGLGVAFYTITYSLYYFMYRSSMTGALQLVQYLAFNVALAIALALVCTAAGFTASSMFVNRLYRGLKVD